jgi:aspartate kinase
MIRVLKFGGTSVGDADSIRNVCRIAADRSGDRMMLVFSAVGATTDRLDDIGRAAAGGRVVTAIDELGKLRADHLALLGEFDIDQQPVTSAWKPIFSALDETVRGVALLGELSPAVHARLLGSGELLSTHLLAAVLAAAGLPTVWTDARELVVTDSVPLDGEPLLSETTNRCRQRLAPLVKAGRVPVIQGFIGRSVDGAQTTLGRGGSDRTAALIGAALGVDEIEIWTDVDGIMTADPRLVPDAQLIPAVSFREATQLARFGARVLHPATLAPAIEGRIPVRVRNTRRPDGPGTLVLSTAPGNDRPVKGVAGRDGIGLILVTNEKSWRERPPVDRVLAVLHRHRVAPQLVATSNGSVALAVDEAQISPLILEELGRFGSTRFTTDHAVVGVVGEQLTDTPGVAGDVLSELGDTAISMMTLGGSGIEIGLVVERSRLNTVVKRLHRRLFGAVQASFGEDRVAERVWASA